tara:strand:+ start:463 stop:1227 length:765 start_codon:yes stop_codon:yes gene_type:complete
VTTDKEKELKDNKAGPKKPSARGRPKAPSGGKKTKQVKAKAAPRTRKSSKKKEETVVAAVSLESNKIPRLLKRFREEISTQLVNEFEYSSVMQVPRLTKIMLNIGIGEEASRNSQAVERATGDMSMISGQRPVTTRARKSIAGFKLREGTPVGIAVTMRNRRMYEFLDRLISSALPRIRDFRGVSPASFDGRGNYSLGIREQIIFPEIDYNSIDRIRGLQVVITTSAKSDREGFRLLELMGMPFAKSESDAVAA